MGKITLPYRIIFILQLALIAAGAILCQLNSNNTLQLQLNQYHTPFLDAIARLGTHLGDGLFALIISLVFIVFLKKKSIPYLFIIWGSSIVAQLLKNIYGPTPRPIEFFKQVPTVYYVPDVIILHSFSFPSGHTATAFGLALALSFYFNNKYVTCVSLLIACFVAFTRVYLMQHFIVDVVIGMIVAMLIGSVTIVLCQHVSEPK